MTMFKVRMHYTEDWGNQIEEIELSFEEILFCLYTNNGFDWSKQTMEIIGFVTREDEIKYEQLESEIEQRDERIEELNSENSELAERVTELENKLDSIRDYTDYIYDECDY